MILSITTLCHSAECHDAESRIPLMVMLNVIIMSAVILSVVMMIVIVLSVVLPLSGALYDKRELKEWNPETQHNDIQYNNSLPLC